MEKYKYLINMGLAFEEDRMMKKLSKMAKEGWILEKMTIFKYKLVKAEPKELIYSMDSKQLDDDKDKDKDKDKDEYFEFFKSSGWEHMCSLNDIHFFSAPPNTIPIYTDEENYLSKYSSSKEIYKKTLFTSVGLLIIIALIEYFLGYKMPGTILEDILFIIGIISVALVVPSLMVVTAYFLKEKKIKAHGCTRK
ncbi:DUF2812 domain-containing protein [Clostridium sp. MSJ-11]|uniref:DUF2812 domain-containing protein n=1 Tax=Clostridium mobile TaxID=2841512 RepID=A0ABS6EH64_9CLOT|nr:DUF2812 domain-containing protein [Clostridium mobile]MBU5484549.1 DUF2812 domain-containing protein [Clostridium mobile]